MIRRAAAFLLLVTSVLLGQPACAEDLIVLSAGAMRQVAAALTPAFEAATGNKVDLRNDTVGGLLHRISAGEPFDVALLSSAGLDELAKAGRIMPETSIKLAQVGIGVGIRRGFARPDITSAAAFKSALLRARAVAYIDPASGGSSGIYLAKLFQAIGIADVMASKSILVNGGLAATAVIDGRADIVMQQISEIVAVPGIVLVGPLPDEMQNWTVYAGAVAANSVVPHAARRFLAALSGPDAWQVLTAHGMTPP